MSGSNISEIVSRSTIQIEPENKTKFAWRGEPRSLLSPKRNIFTIPFSAPQCVCPMALAPVCDSQVSSSPSFFVENPTLALLILLASLSRIKEMTDQ